MYTWQARAIRKAIYLARNDHEDMVIKTYDRTERRFRTEWQYNAYVRTIVKIPTQPDVEIFAKASYKSLFGNRESTSTVHNW